MKPESALALIPGFSGARLDRLLADGPSNRAWLVNRNGALFVLRLDKPGAAMLGLNRAGEFAIAREAAAAGLAPDPVFFDLEAGVLLRCFEPGRAWSRADLERPEQLERLARLLRKLHALPPAGVRFDPASAVARYAAQLSSPAADIMQCEAEETLEEIAALSADRCPCHNDLVCHNIVESDRLLLIDWEYTGVGDPYFDLAVVVQHHRLDKVLTRTFMDAYLGRPALDKELRHLELQQEFYGKLLALWLLVLRQG